MDNNISITKLSKEIVSKFLPQRVQVSNKGTYGNVLNIAGSMFYPGAAYLSSISALKVGAGAVMLASASDVIPLVASNSPDITFLDLGQSPVGTIPKDGIKYLDGVANSHAVSIGCGLSTLGGTKNFVMSFLQKHIESQTPIIIDADAINILSSTNKKLFPLNSIITPHPLELSRLLEVDVKEIQSNRIKWAWEASKYFDCIVLLKGHESVIAVPNGKIFINPTGNSALSKAGAGDVLTGMIAGLCAQGATLENAACLGAYLHGLCGEIASKTQGEYSVLASNLPNIIPMAIKEILTVG